MLPEGTQRTQNELALQVALGMPLLATKGYAAIEVERAYARARELSVQVGDSPQMPTILWGMWVFYLTRGPLEMLFDGEQYRVFAERQQLTPLLLETCQLVGNTLFYLGEFVQALPYLQQGSRLYDPTQHHALIFEHGGADTGVAITTHHALALWTLGYPDRARETMDASIRCARMSAHPFSLAFAHYFSAWLYKLCREESAVHESTTSAISICDEHGFPFWGLSSVALRGSALVEHGAEEAGLTVMREALAAFGATGAELFRSELLGLLAAALGQIGRPTEGLAVISEAFTAMEKSQERWWHAELHRVRGELLSALPGDHIREAESAIQEAVAVAHRQQARSWELRAAMSLSRLWQRQGRAKDAHDFLTDTYRWFTEGLETADLRQARSLLTDLRAHARPS